MWHGAPIVSGRQTGVGQWGQVEVSSECRSSCSRYWYAELSVIHQLWARIMWWRVRQDPLFLHVTDLNVMVAKLDFRLKDLDSRLTDLTSRLAAVESSLAQTQSPSLQSLSMLNRLSPPPTPFPSSPSPRQVIYGPHTDFPVAPPMPHPEQSRNPHHRHLSLVVSPKS